MKLMNTTDSTPAVDPRGRGAAKPTSDTSSNDNQPTPFDGVLADVGTIAKASVVPDSAAKKADGSLTTTTSTTLAPAPTIDTTGGSTTILDALGVLLGKGAPQGAADAIATKSDAKATTPSDDANSQDAVDSLLKRVTKDGAASDPTASNAVTIQANPTDVISILMLGANAAAAQAAPVPSTATPVDAAKLAATAPEALLGAADKSARTKTEGATPASTDMEVVVSDVAVATHLAPATTTPGKAALAADLKPAAGQQTDETSSASVTPVAPTPGKAALAADLKPVTGHQAGGTSSTPVTPAAATAHTQSDDGMGNPRQDADPTATSSSILSSAAINASLAPVRSIATAIGELAAQPAPASAATIPDATKPALGVARTMTLQMSPADLGTVGIRMHITGQTLDVQLTISDPQTLGMVSRERDTLASSLHDQHYELNSLVIQDGGAAASSGGNNAATQGDTSGSNARPDRQSGNASSDTQGGAQQRQGQDTGRPTRDDRRPSRDAMARPVAESRGGLFV